MAVLPGSPRHAEAQSSVSSDIAGFALQGLNVTVGTTVTWTNRDSVLHTTTAGQNGAWDGAGWDSPLLSQNQSFSHTFGQAGSFPYTCRVHPFMNATITVRATPTPTPIPPATPTPTAGAQPSATPAPTSTPSPEVTPEPTATPFPELTVVPVEQITPAEADGGIVKVVQPTTAVTVDLPEDGVRLRIPAPVQQATFQVRLKMIAPDDLAGPSGSKVLRAVQIDLFDVDGNPRERVNLWSSARLRMTLTDADVDEIGGLSSLVAHWASGRLKLQKMSGPGAPWTDLFAQFDISARTFSAWVSTFSTIAIILSDPQAFATAPAVATPPATSVDDMQPAAPNTGGAELTRPVVFALALAILLLITGGRLLLSATRRRA